MPKWLTRSDKEEKSEIEILYNGIGPRKYHSRMGLEHTMRFTIEIALFFLFKICE
jgi:hypothetical protein